jgi:acetyl esterase/lipase
MITGNVFAQNEVIEIWNHKVPNSINNTDYQEINDKETGKISKVTNPTLTVFIPENPNGTSVVICPGGGYAYLSIDKEGYKVAEWFNTLGITAFVLKYRLPSDDIMENKSVGPLQDAQESVSLIRRNASKWNLHPDKIGIIGFSAGGHLAATLSTQYHEKTYQSQDTTSAKPNFSMLIYPVISMTDEIAHKGSRNKLLGKNSASELNEKYSPEKQVTTQTPPAFLVHALDDGGVSFENSMVYLTALKKYNVPAEMHIYESGGHGFGLGNKGTSQFWTEACLKWLQQHKMIN